MESGYISIIVYLVNTTLALWAFYRTFVCTQEIKILKEFIKLKGFDIENLNLEQTSKTNVTQSETSQVIHQTAIGSDNIQCGGNLYTSPKKRKVNDDEK